MFVDYPTSKSNTKMASFDEWLCNLPDPVFYHIFSLLSDEEAVRMGTLSKTLRKRCLLAPDVEFNAHSNESCISGCESKSEELITLMHFQKKNSLQGFVKYLNKLKSLRRDQVIRKFCLRFIKANSDEEGITMSLSNALKCQIQVLELDFMPEEWECLVLPHSNTLKCCSMDLHKGTLDFQSKGFTSLKELSLKSIHIACSCDIGELLSSCSSLSNLTLEEFYGIEELKVASSSLKEINIVKPDMKAFNCIDISAKNLQTLYLAWYFDACYKNKSIRLSTPLLQKLKWVGDVVRYCDIDNPTSIQDVCIELRRVTCLRTMKEISRTDEDSMLDYLAEIFRLIRGARSLQLNYWHIEAFEAQGGGVGGLEPFENAMDLVMNVSELNQDNQLQLIISFLTLFPNLKNLSFKYCRRPWGPNYSSIKALPSKVYTKEYDHYSWIHLKSFEIELTGGEQEIVLLKHVIEHAKGLEKLTVMYSSSDYGRFTAIRSLLQEKKKTSHPKMFLLFAQYA